MGSFLIGELFIGELFDWGAFLLGGFFIGELFYWGAFWLGSWGLRGRKGWIMERRQEESPVDFLHPAPVTTWEGAYYGVSPLTYLERPSKSGGHLSLHKAAFSILWFVIAHWYQGHWWLLRCWRSCQVWLPNGRHDGEKKNIEKLHTGWFFTLGLPLKVQSTEKLILSRLGVSRTIFVNVDSPNLGFTYFNFLGGYQLRKHPVTIPCLAGSRFENVEFPVQAFWHCFVHCHCYNYPLLGRK